MHFMVGSTVFISSIAGRSDIGLAQSREGFYCDENRTPPQMVLIGDGQVINVITFQGEWAPPPYTPLRRCREVAARFQNVLIQSGSSGFSNLTFSYINDQPVMCIANSAAARERGLCGSNELLLTFQNALQGCLFRPAFIEGLAQQAGQSSNQFTNGLDFDATRRYCRQTFSNRVGQSTNRQERQAFVNLNGSTADPETTRNPSTQPTRDFILRQDGILDRRDLVLSDGSLYDEYSFQGVAGQSVAINLTSSDFDTYLLLQNSRGQKISESDDISSNNSNSQLFLTLPYTGTYRLIVNAYDENGRGRYLLIIR